MVYVFFAQFGTVLAQTSTYTGVQSSIEKYLCSPTVGGGNYLSLSSTGAGQKNKAGGDLYNCITKLYKFCVVAAGVLGMFFIVYSGYQYMSAGGNAETVTNARGRITAVISAFAILAMGFVFLKALNPDIIEFKPIQSLSVTLPPAQQPNQNPLEGTGGGDASKIGSAGPCNGCADFSGKFQTNGTLTAGKNTYLQPSLITKLGQINNSNWVINEAYPPTVNHSDSCHFDGSCADIGMKSASAQNLDLLCQALTSAGFSILNEYSNNTYPASATPHCPAPQQYANTTGGHLHIK